MRKIQDIYDDRAAMLGEGPLWHPLRKQLFWFDILGKQMLSRDPTGPVCWRFDEMHSAAGWIDTRRLLLASESGLWTFDIETNARELVAQLDAGNPATRSNDGRADPWGGFWISTMGKGAEKGAGAIWRYYRGELRQLYDAITIPNAISFAPDRTNGHFADTDLGKVWRVRLSPHDGWPVDAPEVFLDLAATGRNPDGAVCDAAGNLWVAEWGASRVACYGPNGQFLRALAVAARHSSCPAFGGDDLTTLFVTSARQGLAPEVLSAETGNGCVFAVPSGTRGLPEPQVVL